ncbi:MAG: hypothetical protein ACNA8H_05665 [Anaerolineales bacterium]
MKYFILPLLLTACLPLIAEVAQEQTKRTCRILYVADSSETISEAYLFDGTTSQKLHLPKMNFSEVIELPTGDLKLSLLSEPGNAPGGFPESAPAVNLTDKVTDFFLLVTGDPDNTYLPVKLTLIDISNNRLKPGETLWINYTDNKISAVLGEDELTILPMKRAISRSSLKKSGYYKAEFTYQREADGDFLPIMRKSWWHDSSSKNLGFIVQTSARLPKIFTIRDHRNIK